MEEEQIEGKKYNTELYTPEAKRARFLKVAEKRTNKILECIRLLGNTSNKSLYKYEQADIDKIFATIDQRLIETRAMFKTKKSNKPFTFE